MERFRFHAKKISGEYEDGEIEAPDQDKALDQLEGQGLVVISIAQISGDLSGGPPRKQPEDAPRGKQNPSARREAPSSAPPLVHWFITGVFILSVSFFVWIKVFASRPASRVPYKIVQVKSVEPKSFKRRDITVQVPAGSTSKIIKIAAQQVYDEQKNANPFLEEARLFFYADNQDPNVHNPIATLRWNWEGYGKWEYNFTLDNGIDAKNQLTLEQLQFKRDKFVAYKFTVYSNVSIKAVQPLAEDHITGLAAEWKGKVPLIKADVYYEGYTKPLMHCELQTDSAEANCRFNAK